MFSYTRFIRNLLCKMLNATNSVAISHTPTFTIALKRWRYSARRSCLRSVAVRMPASKAAAAAAA